MISRIAASLLLVAAVATSAHAEPEFKKHGYLLSRFSFVPPDRSALLYPLLEVEKTQAFFEANADLTLSDDRYTLRSDTSGLIRAAPAGCRSKSYWPGCLVINELYGSYDVRPNELSVLVGRYRPSWGTALSFHPVEPMNAAPDPTDPTFQRLGAWTTQVEYATDKHIATAAWYPAVSHSSLGTPSDIAGGLIGTRYAYRPEGHDISGMAFYDTGTQRPLFGAAGSTTIGSLPFEVHGEALVHQRRALGTGKLEKGTCPITSLGIPERDQWDFTSILGGRWDRGDGTLVNLEYLHNGDGMESADFRGVLATIENLSGQCPNGRLEPSDPTKDGRPQQFSSTFLRRSYGILSAAKPTFGDHGMLANLSATATAFLGLDDMSGVVSGRISYTMSQIAMIRLGGLVPFGSARTQYGMLPFKSLVLLDVQMFL